MQQLTAKNAAAWTLLYQELHEVRHHDFYVGHLVGFVFLLTYFQKDNFVARFCDSVFAYFCSEIITFHYASVLIKTPLLRPDVN